ncbi:MAG: hypothetical protein MRJ68_06105 [Nitrospira sp.]|nr:hypothetical protein [Nitrospira sp.]
MSLLSLLLLLVPLSASAKDLGELIANSYQQNSTANLFWSGSPFARTKSTISLVLTAVSSVINRRQTP